MMDAMVSDRLSIKAQAWRISFSESPVEGRTPLVIIREPSNVFAIAQPIEMAEARAQQGQDEDSLLLIWVPSDAADSHDIETWTKSIWPAEGQGSKQPVIRAGIRTSRTFWSDDRAIIYAAADQSIDAIDAVLRLTVVARQTFDLEQKMAEVWPTLKRHASLIHAVRLRDQRLQPAVNNMTERMNHMKATHLRLATSLEQLDPTLSSASKRLYAELILQASLHDRLEMLEDPIQFALDHYEMANTRLIEAKNALTEFRLEAMICVLLVAEVAATFATLIK